MGLTYELALTAALAVYMSYSYYQRVQLEIRLRRAFEFVKYDIEGVLDLVEELGQPKSPFMGIDWANRPDLTGTAVVDPSQTTFAFTRP